MRTSHYESLGLHREEFSRMMDSYDNFCTQYKALKERNDNAYLHQRISRQDQEDFQNVQHALCNLNNFTTYSFIMANADSNILHVFGNANADILKVLGSAICIASNVYKNDPHHAIVRDSFDISSEELNITMDIAENIYNMISASINQATGIHNESTRRKILEKAIFCVHDHYPELLEPDQMHAINTRKMIRNADNQDTKQNHYEKLGLAVKKVLGYELITADMIKAKIDTKIQTSTELSDNDIYRDVMAETILSDQFSEAMYELMLKCLDQEMQCHFIDVDDIILEEIIQYFHATVQARDPFQDNFASLNNIMEIEVIRNTQQASRDKQYQDLFGYIANKDNVLQNGPILHQALAQIYYNAQHILAEEQCNAIALKIANQQTKIYCDNNSSHATPQEHAPSSCASFSSKTHVVFTTQSRMNASIT